MTATKAITDVGPVARSKFFTNAQLDVLNFGYDGTNLTWKGYIYLMVVWLQQVLNASDLARPGHPVNEIVRKVVLIFKTIEKLEESVLHPSFAEFEPKLCDLLKKTRAETDSFQSDIADPLAQIRDVHECMWDCLQNTVSRELFDKARMFDSLRRGAINGPQTENLTNKMTILENLWHVVDCQFRDACIDLPDKFVWGKEQFTKEWYKFKELINGSGFIKSYPNSVNYVIIVTAMATTKFKHTELLRQVFKDLRHKQGDHLTYTETDWLAFCTDFELAIFSAKNKIIPALNTEVYVEPPHPIPYSYQH